MMTPPLPADELARLDAELEARGRAALVGQSNATLDPPEVIRQVVADFMAATFSAGASRRR